MSSIAKRNLAAAISQRAEDVHIGESVDPQLYSDAKDLLRALARIVNGESLHSAFGAPGDWGYQTPIGRALAEVYREGVTA